MVGDAGPDARGRWLVRMVVLVAAVVVLGPALAPGYVLVRDQVFVPDQVLLPWMLGLGAGLPRSVPQDAVVALLSGPVPGWLLEKTAMLGALLLLGSGVARMLRPAPLLARAAGAVLAIWSAYVAERLLMGHWSLLLAVGVLPWALVVSREVRVGTRGAAPRWLLLVALASLTPTGGLLVLATSGLAILAPRAAAAWPRRATVVLLGLAVQATWVLPALVHPGSGAGAEDGVFALRSEGPWGLLLTALGTGGVWNQEATPLSRGTILAPLLTTVVLVLAVAGIGPLARTAGKASVAALVVASVAGLLFAVASSWGPTTPAASWLVTSLPGGGLLRDSQKWLAPLVVLLASTAPWGALRFGRLLREPAPRGALLVGLLVLPVACLPDLTWGALGRLSSVSYPPDWDRVRAFLATSPLPGAVVSLPWAPLRRYAWNQNRPVLDPAPRYLTRTTLTAADLTVRHGGRLVTVVGDDPQAAQVTVALAAGQDLGPVLARLGVGWALVAVGAGPTAQLPAGADPVLTGNDLRLYHLAAVPLPQADPEGTTVVMTVDAFVLALLAAAAAAAAPARWRHRRRTEQR